MSPKAADPQIRSALIDAAARLLIEHGPDALTTRRLGAEVGTSTMAIYTYFSGMGELRQAISREGFARFGEWLDTVEQTDDPVADIVSQGAAYFLNATANPHLYHFMFIERPPDDPEVGHETFERLIAACARAIEAGRFAKADPERLASQLWAAAHGIVKLLLVGMMTIEEALDYSGEMALALFAAFGDDRERARHSMEEAQKRMLDRFGGEMAAEGEPVAAGSAEGGRT